MKITGYKTEQEAMDRARKNAAETLQAIQFRHRVLRKLDEIESNEVFLNDTTCFINHDGLPYLHMPLTRTKECIYAEEEIENRI